MQSGGISACSCEVLYRGALGLECLSGMPWSKKRSPMADAGRPWKGVAVPAVEITPYGSGPGACARTWIVQQSGHMAVAIEARRGKCCTCWGESMRHDLGSVGTAWSSEKALARALQWPRGRAASIVVCGGPRCSCIWRRWPGLSASHRRCAGFQHARKPREAHLEGISGSCSVLCLVALWLQSKLCAAIGMQYA
jgi:hypothetical protein